MIKPGNENGISANCSTDGLSSRLFRNVKGIIFDFDGTLFDNALIPFYLVAAYPVDALRLWKERRIRKNMLGCDFGTTENYYRAFFTALGKACFITPERAEKWYFGRYMPRMVRMLKKHYNPRPGVTELFRRFNLAEANRNNAALQNGSRETPKVAVYSDYPLLRERLEALGIYSGPGIKLYGPESFGAQKPAARPFTSIADASGITPEETLVIGDREDTDGLGAFKAGMRFFCLETGRKRHFQLDPSRRLEKETPHGPSLLMYGGPWDGLYNLLLELFPG